ncbi:MAG: S8 family peptidase [bacterium]|nr:S8 family peptidase [bacterium]
MLDDTPKAEAPIQFDAPKTDNTDEIAWGVSDVHAPEVWAQGYQGAGVLVGMLDTGVNYNHLDLTTHMWNGGATYPNHGYDFVNNDNNPMDDHGHGTHTAGSVASNGAAGTQAGVAPQAIIMAIKVWNAFGSGSTGQMISGANFAVQQGADIFSMSGGIYGGGTTSDKNLFRAAYNNALAAGVIGTIAAGNEASSPAPPNAVRTPGNVPPPWLHPGQTLTGGLSCVITCGATQSNHNIASWSSRGPVTWVSISPWNDYAYNPGMGLIDPDISAPGVNIKSCTYNNNSGYTLMDGTSMATPHVAGAVALLLSKNHNLTPAQIDMYLETYAQDLGTTGKDNTYGAGLMNVLNAINAVPSGGNPNVTVTVTPTGSTVIPAGGGTLFFSISVHSNEAFTLNTQVWTQWTIPGGGTQGPFINRNVNLAAGSTIARNLQQTVAGSNPAGSYTFWGKMGTGFGGTVYASSSFPFTKSAVGAPGESWYSNNNTYGWDDEVVSSTIPQTYSLGDAYPNPFNPVTTIPFNLAQSGKTSLKVFNLKGQEVATVVSGELTAGQYQVTFNASALSSGIYLYKLDAPGYSEVKKFTLIK